MLKTRDFVEYLEKEEGIKVYKYRDGYYKAFYMNAYIVFENSIFISNVIVRGKFPSRGILKVIVEKFFKEKGVITYYYPDRDLITTAPYKKLSEEEVVEFFRSVYG